MTPGLFTAGGQIWGRTVIKRARLLTLLRSVAVAAFLCATRQRREPIQPRPVKS